MKVERISKIDHKEVNTVRNRLRDLKDDLIEKAICESSQKEDAEDVLFNAETLLMADSLLHSLYRHLTGEENYDYD